MFHHATLTSSPCELLVVDLTVIRRRLSLVKYKSSCFGEKETSHNLCGGCECPTILVFLSGLPWLLDVDSFDHSPHSLSPTPSHARNSLSPLAPAAAATALLLLALLTSKPALPRNCLLFLSPSPHQHRRPRPCHTDSTEHTSVCLLQAIIPAQSWSNVAINLRLDFSTLFPQDEARPLGAD